MAEDYQGREHQPEIPEAFVWTDDVEAWLFENASIVSETTIGTFYDTVANELASAVEAGESIPKIRERIREIFIGMEKWKAEQIARTEVLKASNKGWLEGARQSGVVEGKQWLAYVDRRTCSQCAEMDGVTMPLEENYFDKGEKHRWTDGTESVFDYEEIVTPPLHCDCRCTLLAIVKEL